MQNYTNIRDINSLKTKNEGKTIHLNVWCEEKKTHPLQTRRDVIKIFWITNNERDYCGENYKEVSQVKSKDQSPALTAI